MPAAERQGRQTARRSRCLGRGRGDPPRHVLLASKERACAGQQRRFDALRLGYNTERPHDALGGTRRRRATRARGGRIPSGSPHPNTLGPAAHPCRARTGAVSELPHPALEPARRQLAARRTGDRTQPRGDRHRSPARCPRPRVPDGARPAGAGARCPDRWRSGEPTGARPPIAAAPVRSPRSRVVSPPHWSRPAPPSARRRPA